MNLRTVVASIALLVSAAGIVGCQKSRDMDELRTLAIRAEVSGPTRELLLQIASRNNIEPIPALFSGAKDAPSEMTQAIIDVVSAEVETQLRKIPYQIQPLVNGDAEKLKGLHGDSMYSILRDVEELPNTAKKRFEQWAYAIAVDDHEHYDFQQPTPDVVQFIVTTTFDAGGKKLKQSNVVATVSFSEAKTLSEYARRPASER